MYGMLRCTWARVELSQLHYLLLLFRLALHMSGSDGQPISLGIPEEEAGDSGADSSAPAPDAGRQVSNADVKSPRRFELTILVPPGIPLAFCFYAKGQQILSFRHRIMSNRCVLLFIYAFPFLIYFHSRFNLSLP
jgi:hypothetical protein